MEDIKNVKILRSIRFYFSKAMKFYNLRLDNLTPMIFTIVLAIFFMNYYFINSLDPKSNTVIDYFSAQSNTLSLDFEKMKDMMLLLINIRITTIFLYFVTYFFLGLITSALLIAYIKELKGEVFSLKSCIELQKRNMVKIALLSFMFSFVYNIAKEFFIIPGLIFYSIYLFHMCYALDLDRGIIAAFRSSRIQTQGHRIEIFSIIISFKAIAFISLIFITYTLIAAFLPIESNSMMRIFVLAFINSITFLMETKLTALLYTDLEYGWKSKEK